VADVHQAVVDLALVRTLAAYAFFRTAKRPFVLGEHVFPREGRRVAVVGRLVGAVAVAQHRTHGEHEGRVRMGPRPRHRGAALRTAEVAPLGAAGRRAAASPARAVLGEELGACEEQAPTHVSLHPAAAAPAAAARAAGADEFVVDAVGGAGHGAPRVVLADAVVVATPGLLLELDGDPDLGGALEEKRHGLQALVLGQGPGHLAMLTRRPLIPDLLRMHEAPQASHNIIHPPPTTTTTTTATPTPTLC